MRYPRIHVMPVHGNYWYTIALKKSESAMKDASEKVVTNGVASPASPYWSLPSSLPPLPSRAPVARRDHVRWVQAKVKKREREERDGRETSNLVTEEQRKRQHQCSVRVSSVVPLYLSTLSLSHCTLSLVSVIVIYYFALPHRDSHDPQLTYAS